MIFEVELKFPLTETADLLAELNGLGVQTGEVLQHCDQYFQHPSRNFAKTDEALRIRSENERNFFTYKGALVDERSKTRHEIELPIAEGEEGLQKAEDFLAHLGFHKVREVRKQRTAYCVQWEGRDINLALDEVAGLGTFLEVETFADEAGREAATDSLLRLSERLRLAKSVRKSYLSMLLEQDAAQTS